MILICLVAGEWSIAGKIAAAGSLWADVVQASPPREEPTAIDAARVWFRIANERARRGEYEAALDANRRQLALGTIDPGVVGNGAELLMALGRLDEAIEQYREALAIEERNRDRNSRGDLQGLALGYFGLAVALDRNAQPVAAREAIGRALALDGATAVLQQAQEGNGAIFFLPPGDVFYCLGLLREAEGRADDAAAAFRSYLASPGSGEGTGSPTAIKYAQRARDHLARLAADRAGGRGPAPPSGRGAETRPERLRIVHEATLAADGPLVAPLIDAAWRLHGQMLDSCLSEMQLAGEVDSSVGSIGLDGSDGSEGSVGSVELDGSEVAVSPVVGARGLRLRLEINLDEQGGVSDVTAALPSGLPLSFKACIEDAVRTRFRTSRPTRPKPTRARIELVLAPVGPIGK